MKYLAGKCRFRSTVASCLRQVTKQVVSATERALAFGAGEHFRMHYGSVASQRVAIVELVLALFAFQLSVRGRFVRVDISAHFPGGGSAPLCVVGRRSRGRGRNNNGTDGSQCFLQLVLLVFSVAHLCDNYLLVVMPLHFEEEGGPGSFLARSQMPFKALN